MKKSFFTTAKPGWVIVCLLLAAAGCQKNPLPKLKANYEQVNLVGDNGQYNPAKDRP